MRKLTTLATKAEDATINAYIQYSDKCISNWSKKIKPNGLLKMLTKYCKTNSINKQMRVLDIGCGLGFDSLIFANAGNCIVDSIDVVPQFLDFMKEKNTKESLTNINIIECDFNEILNHPTISKQKYDILYNNASLMHLSKNDFNKWLSDIHKICNGKTKYLKKKPSPPFPPKKEKKALMSEN